MKLTDSKIKWIIKRKMDNTMTTSQIAALQGVDPSRVRQLWLKYKKTSIIPNLKKAGRHPKTISKWEKEKVIESFTANPSNAVEIERILRHQGINISHYTIHNILKDEDLAASEYKKDKRRKWVKYEMKHTNSLWHSDYYMVEDPRWRGKWFLAYIDDASRMITGHGLFDEATTDNALLVLYEAIEMWGKPGAVMTDHGAQFFANYGENKSPGMTSFQEQLARLEIRHILESVGHPQSNGKIERFFGSLQLRLKHFNSIDEYVKYYNERRPHVSLNFDELETPMQAFYRKWDRRKKLPEQAKLLQQSVIGGAEI